MIAPLVRASEAIYKGFDLGVIDRTAEGSAAAIAGAGKRLSIMQTGFIRDYALAFLLGAVLFLGFLLL